MDNVVDGAEGCRCVQNDSYGVTALRRHFQQGQAPAQRRFGFITPIPLQE